MHWRSESGPPFLADAGHEVVGRRIEVFSLPKGYRRLEEDNSFA